MATRTPACFGKPKLRQDSRRLIEMEGFLFWGLQLLFWFFWFFCLSFKQTILNSCFSHADSWLVATTRFCTAISVSTAWGWGYNSIFRCSRSRLFFCAVSLLLLEVAAVVETTLFVFLCLRKAY
jgi:hypothetical protein